MRMQFPGKLPLSQRLTLSQQLILSQQSTRRLLHHQSVSLHPGELKYQELHHRVRLLQRVHLYQRPRHSRQDSQLCAGVVELVACQADTRITLCSVCCVKRAGAEDHSPNSWLGS